MTSQIICSSFIDVVGKVAPIPCEPLMAVFFRPEESQPMEHAKLTQPGWRGFRFAIGRFDPANQVAISETDDDKNAPISTQEEIGFGCYHTVVDYDKLDQQ